MQINTISFPIRGDDRGSLVAVEGGEEIPFDIKRVYYIYGTQEGVVRGKHAHHALKQIIICVHGKCTIVLDDGTAKTEVSLSKPNEGLYISSLVWREMKDFSPDTVLLVFANEHYDESDYIRDYNEFLKCVEAKQYMRLI
jgi:dTDP-4-dehydrorhamnose 3,5-epimerase-like enzyme